MGSWLMKKAIIYGILVDEEGCYMASWLMKKAVIWDLS